MLSSINCKISKHLLLFALNIKWSYSTFSTCHFDQNITIYFILTQCICTLFPNISGLHYFWLSKKSKIHKDFNACLVMYFLRWKKTVVSIIWNGKNDILSTQKIFQCCFLLNSRSVYVTLCFTIKCSSVLIE